MHAGRLITVEGLDGTGKSTLVDGLATVLAELGRPVEVLREPGGVELAERLRELVKDPSLDVHARAEALIYAAARAQLVSERLAPALAAGACVLLDRFVDSSLAYQGAGRGLGIDAVKAINDFATGGLTPDHTLLLWLSPGERARRLSVRGEAPDRLESEPDEFFRAVARAYDELAAAEPGRFTVLDGGRSREQVVEAALAALGPLLGPVPAATEQGSH